MQSEFEIVRCFQSADVVDLPALFDALGVTYREDALPNGISGSIELVDGRYVITVERRDGPQRRRFTAAHELAHYLLHRDMLSNGSKLHRDSLFGADAARNEVVPFRPEHEVQANKFAADLLMPAAKIRNSFASGQRSLAELARRFQVSSQAMAIRLRSLGLDPAQ